MSDSNHATMVSLDNEGYLLFPEQWSKELAAEIAQRENIELSEEHWAVIEFVRHHFEYHQAVPEARHLLKAMKEKYGAEKATRKFVYQLFPYGYGQQACKIAGMRKPLKLMLDV